MSVRSLAALLPQPVLDVARAARHRARVLARGRTYAAWRRRFGALACVGAPSTAPFEVAAFSAPIIKPEGQAHLFDNKLANLSLALAAMQGTVMAPGEVFSFWFCLGAPTAQRGYLPGPTFHDRRVVATPGGGLCQLSGVLYNLALLSGCRIIERHPHSIDAYGEGRYVPLGRDATVAYPVLDLAFQNVSSIPLVLDFVMSPSLLSGRVLSTVPLDIEVAIAVERTAEVASERIVIVDAGVPDGGERVVEGSNGKTVVVRRALRLHDGTRREEILSHDVYRPMPTFVMKRRA